MRIFLEKNVKISSAWGDPPPSAFIDWGLCPQTPRCFFRLLLQLC